MIAIIDYGAGNIFSVMNALEYLNIPSVLTADPAQIRTADAIILPGVGAFPDAMRMLGATGLTALLKEEAEKKPFLGICLGMQMLFDKGWEFEETAGLGLIPGRSSKSRIWVLKYRIWAGTSWKFKTPVRCWMESKTGTAFILFIPTWRRQRPNM